MAAQGLHALLVPYPTEGHINGLLGLAQALANRGLLITFAYPARAHILLQQRNQSLQIHPSITLHILPDGLSTDLNSLPTIFHMQVAFPTMLDSLKLLAHNLRSGSCPISCIISDTFVPWTQDLADELALPRVQLWPSTATAYSMGFHLPELITQGYLPVKENCRSLQAPPVEFIRGLPPFDITELPNEFLMEDLCHDDFQFMIRAFSRTREAHTILVNSLHELERSAFDGLQSDHIPICSVGPLFPPTVTANTNSTSEDARSLSTDRQCLAWLDQQHVSSVVYIAFGSFSKLSLDETHEMALGLEASGHPFLWVIRADSIEGDLGDNLPEGFLSRTAERSRIISWAPQQEVLKHASIGVFLSHCGWNSTLDSIWGGKAMVACPRASEQRSNARQIVDQWKVGVELKRQENGSFTRKAVEEAVRAIMLQPEFRQRAFELQQIAQQSLETGGKSDKNLKDFLQNLKLTYESRNRNRKTQLL